MLARRDAKTRHNVWPALLLAPLAYLVRALPGMVIPADKKDG